MKHFEYAPGQFAHRVANTFSGDVYVNVRTASDDNPFSIAVNAANFPVIIAVVANPCLIGNVSSQYFLVAAGTQIQLSNVDLSALRFKNSTPGSNTTIQLLGAKE